MDSRPVRSLTSMELREKSPDSCSERFDRKEPLEAGLEGPATPGGGGRRNNGGLADVTRLFDAEAPGVDILSPSLPPARMCNSA